VSNNTSLKMNKYLLENLRSRLSLVVEHITDDHDDNDDENEKCDYDRGHNHHHLSKVVTYLPTWFKLVDHTTADESPGLGVQVEEYHLLFVIYNMVVLLNHRY